MSNFKYRFIEAKSRSGLPCEDIAAEVCVTRRTIQSWLSGHSQPKADQISALASLLMVTPSELLSSKSIVRNITSEQQLVEIIMASNSRDLEMILRMTKAYLYSVRNHKD